jgi:hypothetical protein
MLFRYGNPELHQVAILFTDIKQPNRFSRRWMASRLAGTFASDPGALRRRSLRSQFSARWRTNRRWHDAGFDLHLVKPVEPDLLLALLAGVAQRRGGQAHAT